MLDRALLLLCLVPVLALACGSDDEEDSKTELERACQSFCDAASTAGCPIANCHAGCSYLEDQFGTCAGAYADLYSCAAEGDVECVNGFPQPTSAACAEPGIALGKCVQEQPCRDFCLTAESAGCGGQACIDRCVADEAASTFCSIEHDDLAECQAENAVVCKGDAPVAPEACSALATEFFGCVAAEHPCEGECMAAELAGCGGESRAACVAACTQTLEEGDCTSQHQQLLQCHAQNGLACSGAEVSSTPACTGQQDAYDACAAM